MNFYQSLAFKNAIRYLLIFLTGLGIMGFLLLDNSSKRILQTAENQLLHSGDLIEVQLKEYVNGLVSGLDFLSKNPLLLRYLTESSDENRALLSDEFLTLINSKADFAQIRYLDASNGLEIVRVDQKNGVANIVPEAQLQNKSDRAYFKVALTLDPKNIYFSPINLNREFGKISKPHTPTLRVARSIYHENELQGIIVINTDLTKIFEKLRKSVGSNYTLRIVNDAGFYLMHENQDSTFTFEFGSEKAQVSKQFLNEDHKLISLPNEIISVHRMNADLMTYPFQYHVIANRSLLLKPYYEWRNKSILLILFIALLFAGIAFFILSTQSKNLKELTKNMRQFTKERQVSELPVNRNDEIGELARSFKEMAIIINQQMESIETEKHKAIIAEKEKSNFIENISHEIRNPLQSILGLSNILEQNRPNPNQIDILKSIKLNTSNLFELVNSILDYQSVIKGNVKSELVWVELNDLVQELTIGSQYAASQKSIQIETDIVNQPGSIEFKIDRLRISQILSNLIANAISHTHTNGTISVSAEMVEHTAKGSKIKFTVSDNGVGMTEAEILRIKERYYTNTKDEQQVSNFGLGLTIVHELLGLMGSSLHIDSKKNSGSTFSFEIESATRAKQVENSIDFGFEGFFATYDILIIDDDRQVLDFYKHIFGHSKTLFVQSFDELEETLDATFDIIISDFRLGSDDLLNHLPKLQQLSHSDTCLLILSGAVPDLTPIQELYPDLIFAQKPMNRKAIFQLLSTHLITTRYGQPELNVIKKDYDFNRDKYNKAITLLSSEWEVYNIRLENSIKNKDIEELDEILHKFRNTLRRLKLSKFEDHLEALKHKLTFNTLDIVALRNEIKLIMITYQSLIKSSID